MTEGAFSYGKEGCLMTCLRTMRQPALFRQMDIIPQPPSPLCPQAPFLSFPQVSSRPSRMPLPGLPTVPFPAFPQAPFLSFPQFLAGIQSKQSCPRGQSGVISLRQGEHDRRLARSMVSDDQ